MNVPLNCLCNFNQTSFVGLSDSLRSNIFFLRFVATYRSQVGGWGVLPTGKSISVSVAVALRACVRAKLCAGA